MSFGIPVRNGLGVGLLASTSLSSLRIGGRPAMSLDFIGTNSLDSRVTFTRGTTATFVGSNGLIQTAAINAPRFDYDPTTLAPKGLLIEEARTNLALRSEEFDNVVWVKSPFGVASAPVVTANFGTSPDGTTNADRVQMTLNGGTTTADRSLLSQVVTIVTSTTYTFSVWLRSLSGTVAMGIGCDNVAGNTPITVTSTWQRFTLSGAATGVAGLIWLQLRGGQTPTQANAADVLIYGAQLEAGAFATSYIPTTTLAAPRSADVAQMTGTNFSSWYNPIEGTFAFFGDTITANATKMGLNINDGSTANRLDYWFVNGGLGLGRFTSIVANVTTADSGNSGTPVVASNTAYGICAAYKQNSFAWSFAANTPGTAASGNLPVVDRLDIGNRIGFFFLNGHVRRIAYYNTRLPNATVQALSA